MMKNFSLYSTSFLLVILFMAAMVFNAQVHAVALSFVVFGLCIIGFVAKTKFEVFKTIDLFFVLFYLVVITNVIDLFSPFKSGAILDILLIVLSMVALFYKRSKFESNPILLYISLTFIVVLFIGVLSSFFSGWSNAKSAIYQAVYFFKWPLMISVGLLCEWNEDSFSKLYKGIWLYILIVVLFILLELSLPGVYREIGRNLLEFRHTSNPFTSGMSTRGTGPFSHSSILAFFSCLFFCYVFSDFLQKRKSEPQGQRILIMLFMFLFVIHSGQQQEFLAAIICCALIFCGYVFKSFTKSLIFSIGLLVLSVSALFVLLGDEQLFKLSSEWGFSDGYVAITSARPVFFLDSVHLANKYFPLGTGFGTFAGVGAKLYNRDLYESLGYGFYWWYRQDIFLLDTYWPNFLAELGWFSLILLVMVPIVTIAYCYKKYISSDNLNDKRLFSYSFSSLLFCSIVSITSPIYSDPSIVLFSFMLLGMSLGKSKFSKSFKKESLP